MRRSSTRQVPWKLSQPGPGIESLLKMSWVYFFIVGSGTSCYSYYMEP